MDQSNQTEAVFKSSRTEVDPVSGNEVPPGAMAEEVRDDVPAMLSEGEYVVPADVLRYFGVKFFEDLKDKAKDELVELEDGGRIGGEPIEDDMDDLPFDVSELSVVEDEEGDVQGFAEGGVVTQMNQPSFLTGVPTPGASADEYKTFKNDAGLIMNIRFVNGKPVSYIPPGYKEQGTAVEEVAPEATTPAVTKAVEPGEGPSQDDLGRTAADDGLDVTEAPSYGVGGKGASTALGAGLGAIFGGPMGAVSGGKAGMQAAAFNDARNDLADALMSNDKEAISKAEQAVTETHDKLGFGAKVGVFNEGKTGKNAIANINKAVEAFKGVHAEAAPTGMTQGVTSTGELGYTRGEGLGTGGEKDARGKETGYSKDSLSGMRAGMQKGVDARSGKTGGTGKSDSKGVFGGYTGLKDAVDGGGPGASGDKVICTALHSMGLLSDDIYALDTLYGVHIATHDPALRSGYHKWAIPVAEYIKGDSIGSKLTLAFVAPLAKAWASQMAHEMQPEKYKRNLLGKAIMAVGHPICRALGKTKQETLYGL